MIHAELVGDPLAVRSAEVPSFPICLEFSPDIPVRVRSRISYAFRVFAAIYAHPVQEFGQPGTIRCVYGGSGRTYGDRFVIPALYQDTPSEKSNEERFIPETFAGHNYHLRYGKEASTGRPDWLGEIFQWLSGSYELSNTLRDLIGRIPFSGSVFQREGISPHVPYAMLLMAWMESALLGQNEGEELPKAPSPVPGLDHLVICSHDIDFHLTSRSSAVKRLLKNMLLAFPLYRSPALFRDSCKMLFDLLGGERPGNYIPRLLDAAERSGIRSTFFVVASRMHRRDPDYRIEQLRPYLDEASERGFSVGLHGSYQSIIERRDLAGEASVFKNALGYRPRANRQHWLRFDRHASLFDQLELAAMHCDSTLGFPDRVGFRNAASFAFPPYDFANERAHNFLEIPLALMDGGLATASRALQQNPQTLAESVLGESRKYGWGGISILWHNPIEPISVPAEINEVFWKCACQAKEKREAWMSVDQFLAVSLPRYQRAGLLQGVSLHG